MAAAVTVVTAITLCLPPAVPGRRFPICISISRPGITGCCSRFCSGLDRRNSFTRFHGINVVTARASCSEAQPSDGGKELNEILDGMEVTSTSSETWFLIKMAVALGIAVTATLVPVFSKNISTVPSFGLPYFLSRTSQSQLPASAVGYTLKLFGSSIFIPEHTPGWVYFWLLMAAGCGLFISEEALNVWVGISLARTLTIDGTWQSLASSFSSNSAHIISTVLWVYWGVCISDMIPFYLGRLFRKTKASDDICSKLGIGKERALTISDSIRKYGNLIGFVERFSLGVRNPTAFLAGALGISSDCFFAGVCCGGIITLSAQLAVGFLLRGRPVVALASVAAAVGIWTAFPYAVAASTALYLFLRKQSST